MLEKQDPIAIKVTCHGSHGSHGGQVKQGDPAEKKHAEKLKMFATPQLNSRNFSSYHSVINGILSVEVRSLGPLGLTREDIRQIIPDRTLERRIADGENLKIEEADGISRLLRVVAMARRVFANDVLADEWLRSANPSLDGLVPMHMARTDLGGREVEAILGRIEHGVFG